MGKDEKSLRCRKWATRLSLHVAAGLGPWKFKSDLWADLFVQDACQGCITLCSAQELQAYESGFGVSKIGLTVV